MKALLFCSVVPLLLTFAACNDRVTPGGTASSSSGQGDDDDDDDVSSSSGGSSSGRGGSSGGGSTSSGSSSGNPGPFTCPSGQTESKLRIVTGNISNGDAQNYNDGTGLRIFKGLAPDIALVQEMNYQGDSEADFQTFVANGFGEGYTYFRGAETGGGAIPNGVVSRYPITGSGEGPLVGGNRAATWARIDVPGDADVIAISVHLSTTGSNRPKEANDVVAIVQAQAHDGDLVVLGGDFNTDTRQAEGVSQLSGTFTTSGPYPVDETNNDGTNTNRNEEGKAKPYDWVVGNDALHARRRTSTIGDLSFPNGLVFDSRVFSDLSLLPGVEETDSSLHQHMAVLRTFALCE